jgi:hypothetical protein
MSITYESIEKALLYQPIEELKNLAKDNQDPLPAGQIAKLKGIINAIEAGPKTGTILPTFHQSFRSDNYFADLLPDAYKGLVLGAREFVQLQVVGLQRTYCSQECKQKPRGAKLQHSLHNQYSTTSFA